MSDWRDEAACHPDTGIDPEMFYPVGFTGPAIEQAEAAKRICADCPVLAECREFAFETFGRSNGYGVWGGLWLDAGEARAYRRRQVVVS